MSFDCPGSKEELRCRGACNKLLALEGSHAWDETRRDHAGRGQCPTHMRQASLERVMPSKLTRPNKAERTAPSFGQPPWMGPVHGSWGHRPPSQPPPGKPPEKREPQVAGEQPGQDSAKRGKAETGLLGQNPGLTASVTALESQAPAGRPHQPSHESSPEDRSTTA